MSQEQIDQVQPPTLSEESELATTPAIASGKRAKKKAKQVTEEELLPRPSYWPLALAVALIVLLMGAITHPLILGLGVVLVAVAIIGWGIERR